MLVEVTSDDIALAYKDPTRCPLERALERKLDKTVFCGYAVYGYRETGEAWPLPKKAAQFAKSFDATILHEEEVVKPQAFEFNEQEILP